MQAYGSGQECNSELNNNKVSYPTCVRWILSVFSLSGAQVAPASFHSSIYIHEEYECINYNKNPHKESQVVVLSFLFEMK